MTLVRARASLTYPARFHLVAAMNPCPCGHHTGREERCTCDPAVVRRYAGRVSGPLLDRIDLHVDVPAVRWRELRDSRRGEPTARVRERVLAARERAGRRFARLRGGRRPPSARDEAARGGAARNGNGPGAVREPAGGSAPIATGAALRRPVNATLTSRELERVCRLDGAGESLLRRAVDRYGLSARGYHRVLRLARTVADLAGSDPVRSSHVAEAVSYRVLDRGGG